MDLNELLFQHQLALINAGGPARGPVLGSRFDMVQHYERRLRKLRQELGVTHRPDWFVRADARLPRC